MKAAFIALAALALSPALSHAASKAKPVRSSAAAAAPIKCVDGTKSTNRTNPCVGHGGVDKAVQAAVTEHASAVRSPPHPPTKIANHSV